MEKQLRDVDQTKRPPEPWSGTKAAPRLSSQAPQPRSWKSLKHGEAGKAAGLDINPEFFVSFRC